MWPAWVPGGLSSRWGNCFTLLCHLTATRWVHVIGWFKSDNSIRKSAPQKTKTLKTCHVGFTASCIFWFSDQKTCTCGPQKSKKKIVIRGYGRAAFHLSPADYIPGRHCDITCTHATSTIDTSDLCSMQSLGTGRVLTPPSSFRHHSRWLEAGGLYAPAITSLAIFG